MKTTLRYIGLDVHQDSIAIAVAEAGRSPARCLTSIPHDWHKLVAVLDQLGERTSIRLCYEAGPTGYELARRLRDHGWHAIVVAPALVPEKKKHLKTDRRDAATLAHFLRSGDLTEVSIPAAQTEAMRDLERARTDAKTAERVARQHVMSFMLRHNRRWPGGTNWTQKHREWLHSQVFVEPAQQRVLADYLRAVDQAELRVQALTDDIGELVEQWALRPLVLALQALRGFQLVGSVLVTAEIGCFSRFATASEFMAFLGLVPSEHSSGARRSLGRITRAGNRHVRRMLIEAAWTYRRRGKLSKAIAQRRDLAPDGARAIAEKAEERLCRRFTRLTARGKKSQVVVTAIARELAGFVWAIARKLEQSGIVPGVDTRLAERGPEVLPEIQAALAQYTTAAAPPAETGAKNPTRLRSGSTEGGRPLPPSGRIGPQAAARAGRGADATAKAEGASRGPC